MRVVSSIWITFSLLVALIAAGCGATAAGLGAGIRRGAATSPEAYQQAISEGDAAWAQRGDRAQLELAIQKYTAAVQLKDDDWPTYEKLSRAYNFLAYGFLFFEQETNMAGFLAAYEKGYQTAQRGLAAFSPELESRINAGVDLKDAVALVGKDGVGLIYWYATNLGRWGNAQDITVVLKYKERIYNMMSRALELDPSYFHGAPYRYFGAYYAIAPSFAGGDLDKSWKFFQDAIKAGPDYLATYNLIAENYAPKKQDAKLFDEMIAKVMSTPADVLPDVAPEATIEKKHAERLKKAKDAGELPL